MKRSYLYLFLIALAPAFFPLQPVEAGGAKDLVIENNRTGEGDNFFQPVNNLLDDLQKQGVTIADPADRMSIRYQVSTPCPSCSVYLGTGVSNGEKDLNNGMGVNLGVGFSMPFSK